MRAVFAEVAQQALNDVEPIKQRQTAINLLASAPYDVLAQTTTQLVDVRQPLALQLAAVKSLSQSADERVAKDLLANWEGATPRLRAATLEAIFARNNRLPGLLDALQSGLVRPGEIDVRWRDQLTKSKDPRIANGAITLFAQQDPDSDLQQRIEMFQQALTNQPDMNSGHQVFAKHCINCHKIKTKVVK